MDNKVVEYITRIVLLLLAAASVYLLVDIIREPILAKQRMEKREDMVKERLKNARLAQKTFKDKYGRYTASWDTLMHFIKKDTLTVINTIGDPNTPDSLQEQKVRRDTSYALVKNELFTDYNQIDSIQYAPFTGKKFKMDAGKIKLRGVAVHVFEIKDLKANRNDKTLKVGSMKKGITSGNW